MRSACRGYAKSTVFSACPPKQFPPSAVSHPHSENGFNCRNDPSNNRRSHIGRPSPIQLRSPVKRTSFARHSGSRFLEDFLPAKNECSRIQPFRDGPASAMHRTTTGSRDARMRTPSCPYVLREIDSEVAGSPSFFTFPSLSLVCGRASLRLRPRPLSRHSRLL